MLRRTHFREALSVTVDRLARVRSHEVASETLRSCRAVGARFPGQSLAYAATTSDEHLWFKEIWSSKYNLKADGRSEDVNDHIRGCRHGIVKVSHYQ